MKKNFAFLFLSSCVVVLAACSPARLTAPPPSALPSFAAFTATAVSPSPSPVPSATASPSTPTAEPLYLVATGWSADPVVPVLAYHQFQEHGLSGATRVRIDD